jgi:hypothetical protein
MSPPLQAHVPPVQAVPPVHVMPHEPQLFGSVVTSTQLAPQSVWPAGHAATQAPIEHTWSAPQTLLQAPQLLTSVLVSTHTPLQLVCGLAQPQVPPRHVVPLAHTIPHDPQFELSDFKSTHDAAHALRPVPHIASHLPALHTCIAVHAVPHAPQLFGSFAVSTHDPLQVVVPCGQTQALPLQISVDEHAVPHAPQLRGSLVVSTQEAAHLVSMPEQLAEQTPRSQTCALVQAAVQVPQWLGSVDRSTQEPLHIT